jgi:hypothetical protein
MVVPGWAVVANYSGPMTIRHSALGLLLLVTLLQSVVVPVSASADPGWGAPVTLGSTGRETAAPEIAVAPDGEAIATWVGLGRKGLQVSTRRPGEGWSTPIRLAPAGGDPHVAVAAGKAVVVWSGGIRTRRGSGPVVLAATRLAGMEWGRPRNISKERRWRSEPTGEEPQVAISPRGRVAVIWRAHDEGHSTTSFIRSATQLAGKTRWTRPAAISGSIEGESPEIGLTPEDETVAIWGATYNEESGIDVSSRPQTGPWGRAERLARPGAYPEPQLAVTSNGEAIGAWVERGEEGFSGVLQVATRKPGEEWKVETLAPQSHAASPRIVTEPAGGAKVVWVMGESPEKQEIVAATHSPTGGWSAPERLTVDELKSPIEANLDLEVTAAGESVAAWSTFGATGGLTIHASSQPPGQPWTASTEIFTGPTPRLYGAPDLQLAVAPSDETFAIWRCFDGSKWVIKTAARPPSGGSGQPRS